jgi:hypothetical protein
MLRRMQIERSYLSGSHPSTHRQITILRVERLKQTRAPGSSTKTKISINGEVDSILLFGLTEKVGTLQGFWSLLMFYQLDLENQY